MNPKDFKHDEYFSYNNRYTPYLADRMREVAKSKVMAKSNFNDPNAPLGGCINTVFFDNRWDKDAAELWLSKNDFSPTKDVYKTGEYLNYKLAVPSGKSRQVSLGDGIYAMTS